MLHPLVAVFPPRQLLRLGSGIRLRTDVTGTCARYAEFSLARVLFGHNGVVLKNQHQLDAAVEKAESVLGAMIPGISLRSLSPRRIDIAWNFSLRAREHIIGHSGMRIRGVRRGPAIFNDYEGLSWKGCDSRLVIRMYDKSRQMHVCGSVLRVEISLSANQIRSRLGVGHWSIFESLYSVFRSMLAELPAIEATSQVTNWRQALALESAETRRRVLGRIAMSRRSERRYRMEIEAAAARQGRRFSWGEYLPVAGPPKAVSVIPRKALLG